MILQNLDKLYSQLEGRDGLDLPYHSTQNSHIQIHLDSSGNFLAASLGKLSSMPIPVTEKSRGRTSGMAPHPLCDKIQYVAKDYRGPKPGFDLYYSLLNSWAESAHSPQKVVAVRNYVAKGTTIQDLSNAGLVDVRDGTLVILHKGDSSDHPVYALITPGRGGRKDQKNLFVRWVVEVPGAPPGVWEDEEVKQSWINYEETKEKSKGYCAISGETGAALAQLHPALIRHAADNAKLISSNDERGYTYRGEHLRHLNEVCPISNKSSLRSHSALRWLVRNVGHRVGDLVIVAWDSGGDLNLPDPFEGDELFADLDSVSYDPGKAFSTHLRKAIYGFKSKVSEASRITVAGLNSSNPGRLAVVLYRDLASTEFLENLVAYQTSYAWTHTLSGERVVGAPSLFKYADVLCAKKDRRDYQKVVTRLFPVVIDGSPFPRDMLNSLLRKVYAGPVSGQWKWNQTLEVACSAVRGTSNGEYKMGLEENNNNRSYLYGRLAACANRLEEYVLWRDDNKRSTTVMSLLPRLQSRPLDTWRHIQKRLLPYQNKLRVYNPGLSHKLDKLMNSLLARLDTEEELQSRPLDGLFVLGYSAQRNELFDANKSTEDSTK